ncbi:MAG: hypothetical protein HWE23_02250 [Rhodobacteraceae bacterium]|nr:hypothetical protein [Paracoccaceae bacterium]
MAEIYELTAQDTKTLQERCLKLCEESGEVAQAVLSATGAPGSAYKKLTLADVREEALDTVIVAMAIFAQASESREAFDTEFSRLLDLKVSKWIKTLEAD